jgi:hypothetical protein
LGFAALSTNLQEHFDAACYAVLGRLGCSRVSSGINPAYVRDSLPLGFAALGANLQEHSDAD